LKENFTVFNKMVKEPFQAFFVYVTKSEIEKINLEKKGVQQKMGQMQKITLKKAKNFICDFPPIIVNIIVQSCFWAH
jgi:ABC-type sugar transport system ATPase subunit